MQIGPFHVNWVLATFFIAAAAAYFAVAIRLRLAGLEREPYLTIFFNGFVLGVAGWKFAPVLTGPDLLWKAPLKLIMMPGGSFGALLGGSAALLYVLVRSLRAGVSLPLLADLAAFGAAVFAAVRAIAGGPRYGAPTEWPWGIVLSDPAYAYHPLHWYEAVLAAAIAIASWARYRIPGDGRAAVFVCYFGGIGFFALSFVEGKASISPALLLTPAQWAAVFAVLFGLFLPRLHILWTALQERGTKGVDENSSKAQRAQERENERAARRQPLRNPADPAMNKKTDGPNRPAE